MLQLLAAANPGTARQVRARAGVGERREALLAAYVDTMLERRRHGLRHSEARLRQWLGWLARAMLDRGQTVLQLEWMQPDLLTSRSHRLVVLATPGLVGSALVLLLVVVPPVGVLGAPPMTLSSGLVEWTGALALFLVPVLLVSTERTIRPRDRLSWSRRSLARSFWRSYAWGAALALVLYVAVATTLWTEFAWRPSLGDVRLVGTLTVLVGTPIWVVAALEGTLGSPRALANQGMRTSWRNVLLFGGPLVALAVCATVWTEGTRAGVFAPFLTLAGVLVSLQVGGRAVLQHAALRVLLAVEGKAPLRLATALDAAVSLDLMRRAGGGWVFLHRLLLEHLAGAASGDRPSPSTVARSTTSDPTSAVRGGRQRA